MQPILVTGGTGTLGRLVVARLQDEGCEVQVLSRRSHTADEGITFVTGDLATGAGAAIIVQLSVQWADGSGRRSWLNGWVQPVTATLAGP